MKYQTTTLGKGERDCNERWSVIAPYLPKSGVVLDVGAAEGYFLNRIADDTDLLAVGVEKHKGRVENQKKLLAGKSGIICDFEINKSFTYKLTTTCEFFDSILLLSALHWINCDHVLRDLSMLAGTVFVEIPSIDDYSSTGQKFMQRVRACGSEREYLEVISQRHVKKIGEVKAHTSETRNLWLIHGPFSRTPSRPHIDYEKEKKQYLLKYINGQVEFYKKNEQKEWVNGVNFATLLAMNMVSPGYEWWERHIREVTDCLDQSKVKGDLRAHNLIITRERAYWIDLDHHAHKTTIFEDIKKCLKA